MRYLRWLLFPVSLLYGLAVIIRNWFYDTGIFKSQQFDLPVISTGNLEVGGAGKSPMTEYLIRLLRPHYPLATLSRGYGRQTKGFLIAGNGASADQTGDEPAQFRHKFPDITVAVCEDRVAGIHQLMNGNDLILLDDAFQHRAVIPGLSILLFDYHYLQQPRLLLPAGNLREPFSGRWRADVMVVTKCPPGLTQQQFNTCYERLAPFSWQPVYFSAITYEPLQDTGGRPAPVSVDRDTTVFLLTGIANPVPLLQHFKMDNITVIHHKYPDHHQFNLKNIIKLASDFAACKAQKKIVVTTEKDAQRLWVHGLHNALAPLPVYMIPITVRFLNNGQQEFNELILNYVREHTKRNQLH